MQYILAVLVEGALRGPSHQQNVEGQSVVVIVLARKAHQLSYPLFVLHK